MKKTKPHFIKVVKPFGIRGEFANKGSVWCVSKAEKLNLVRRSLAVEVDVKEASILGKPDLMDGPISYEPVQSNDPDEPEGDTSNDRSIDLDTDEFQENQDEPQDVLEDPVPTDTTIELNGEIVDMKPKNMTELKAMAKKLGIKGYSTKREDELIKMIQVAVKSL